MTELSVRYHPRQLVTITGEEEDWRPGGLQLQIRRAGGCWQQVQGDPIQVSQYNTLIRLETFLHVKHGFEFISRLRENLKAYHSISTISYCCCTTTEYVRKHLFLV